MRVSPSLLSLCGGSGWLVSRTSVYLFRCSVCDVVLLVSCFAQEFRTTQKPDRVDGRILQSLPNTVHHMSCLFHHLHMLGSLNVPFCFHTSNRPECCLK